jgi:hypothetical protein
LCKIRYVGFSHYESELRFKGLIFRVGDVNIGEGTGGSIGHSVNYMLNYFIYVSVSNYIENILV